MAYGRRRDGGASRAFLRRDGTVVLGVTVDRPTAGAVANDGTFAVVEGGGADTTVHRLRAFDGDGVERLSTTLDATVRDVAVSPSGHRVVVATRNPDASVRAYDARTGDPVWTVAPRRTTPKLLGFHGDGYLYVARERRPDEPYLALDDDGEVAWGSERYKATQPFSSRVRGWIDRRT